MELNNRDMNKPTAAQGLFRKFEVYRTDRADGPGGKHHGCEYFVLDLTHDLHAMFAMRAYASSCRTTHPLLADDIEARHGKNGALATLTARVAELEASFAYGCPVHCGCLWRDNGDGTMSLFDSSQKSCQVCEPMPLEELVSMSISDHLYIDQRGDGIWLVCVEGVFKTENAARLACRQWKKAYSATPAPANLPLEVERLTLALAEAGKVRDSLINTLQSAKDDFELFAAQYGNPDMKETAVAIGAQLLAAPVASQALPRAQAVLETRENVADALAAMCMNGDLPVTMECLADWVQKGEMPAVLAREDIAAVAGSCMETSRYSLFMSRIDFRLEAQQGQAT